jgi:hypothetical protein
MRRFRTSELLLALNFLSWLHTSAYAETEADAIREFERGDLQVLKAAVSGLHSVGLTAFANKASANAFLTPEIGDRLRLGKAGIDYVCAPAVHVAMTGTTLQHAEVAYLFIHRGGDPVTHSLEIPGERTDFAPAIMYTIGYQVKPNSSRVALLEKVLQGFPQRFNMTRVNAWVKGSKSSPPLHCAVQARIFDAVYLLSTVHKSLPAFTYDPNQRNMYGQTALMLAAMNGEYEFAEVMIHNRLKIMVEDKFGRTCLHYAAMAGRADIIKLIVDSSAVKDLEVIQNLIGHADKEGRTALGLASLAPARISAVRALRTKMTAVGLVPSTVPWLVKPLVCELRNTTEYLLKTHGDIRSHRLDFSDQRTGDALRLNSTDDIDCVSRSIPWTNETRSWFKRDYVSTRRPVLIHHAISSNNEKKVIEDIESQLGHLHSAEKTSLRKVGLQVSTVSGEDGSLTLSEFIGLLQLYKKREMVLSESGEPLEDLKNDADSKLNVLARHLFAVQTQREADSSLALLGVVSEIHSLFPPKQCTPPNHGLHNVFIDVSSVGGIINGTVDYDSHFHYAIVSGVSKVLLFAPPANRTAGLKRAEILDRLLRQPKDHSQLIERFLKFREVQKYVEMYEIVQIAGDVLYVPPAWSFIMVATSDVVSILSQDCMIDVRIPSCERHSVNVPIFPNIRRMDYIS